MAKVTFTNETLNAFVNKIKSYVDAVGAKKADMSHAHDDKYYTEAEIDSKVAALNSSIAGKVDAGHVDTKISTHNSAASTHNDIRALIDDLTTKLNNFLDVDDKTTDQLSEVLTLINNNKGTLESLTTNKVNVADVINNLTTNSANKVLSAAQGVAIKSLIDALQAELDSHTHAIADVSGLQTALDGKAASSHGTHVSYSTTAPVMDGTASAGTASTVARSDHKHPVDTSRAAKADLDALSSTVAGKANTSHTHTVANISDLTATAAELNYMDGVTSNVQTQLNKKANDYSLELYNGTSGNPKPVKFLTVNYSTCGSENGVAIKIGMVSGHGNGSSYAFLQDAIIRVTHTGTVEVDNFKYYGAATGTYDGANRQYGDIFWLIDTTNKVVDFYCLMGQYARIQMTPYKRVTYSTGGTITQHTSCAVYSSGTKVWANNSNIALSSGHYTKAEMDNIVNTLNTAIGGKAASSHTHDDRYYTEAEINAKVDALNAAINGKAPSNHTHSNMIVKLNSGSTEGTNMFTYNGGTAKTVNITPASIGAQVAGSYAAASHAHDDKYYTETEIDSKINTLNTAISGKAASSHTHSISNVTNLQSTLDSKSDSGHTHNYAGSSSAGGAATSANKVNSSMTVQLNGGTTEGTNMFTFNGSASKAMNITPSAIGAAASSHSHDDKYYTEAEIDSKVSTLNTAISGKANSSHTHSISNVTGLQSALDGKQAAGSYAVLNVGNTFDGEQKMLNKSYCPTMNDIASGVGCSLKNSRACDNQLIVAEVYAPTTAATDNTINMTSTVGEIPFYHGGGGSDGQFSGKTLMGKITTSGWVGNVVGNVTGSATSLSGLTATVAELNHCDGVTSNIQTQLNSKLNNAVFIATSQTTFAEIKAAYDAGKMIMVRYFNLTALGLGEAFFPLTYINNNIACFFITVPASISTNQPLRGLTQIWRMCSSTDGWSNSAGVIIDLNRTTSVNENDTNYTQLMARGTSLNNTDTSPAVNGAIAWTYA